MLNYRPLNSTKGFKNIINFFFPFASVWALFTNMRPSGKRIRPNIWNKFWHSWHSGEFDLIAMRPHTHINLKIPNSMCAIQFSPDFRMNNKIPPLFVPFRYQYASQMFRLPASIFLSTKKDIWRASRFLSSFSSDRANISQTNIEFMQF